MQFTETWDGGKKFFLSFFLLLCKFSCFVQGLGGDEQYSLLIMQRDCLSVREYIEYFEENKEPVI